MNARDWHVFLLGILAGTAFAFIISTLYLINVGYLPV